MEAEAKPYLARARALFYKNDFRLELCPPSAAVQRQTPSATQVCRARLAPKAKDLLQALLDALVDVAGVGVGLWFSYLFILFYLLIVVSPLKLPFLNMDLPHLMIVVSCR